MGYLIMSGNFKTNSGEDWLKYLEQNDSFRKEGMTDVEYLKAEIEKLKKENVDLKKKLGIKGEYRYNGHMGTMAWEQFPED